MSIINNMPSKGNININGLLEEYYAYAGEEISAGNFVEFVNGVSGLEPIKAQYVPSLAWYCQGVLLDDERVVVFSFESSSGDQRIFVVRFDEYNLATVTTTVANSTLRGTVALFTGIWEGNIVYSVSHRENDKVVHLNFEQILSDDTVVHLADTTYSANDIFAHKDEYFNDHQYVQCNKTRWVCGANDDSGTVTRLDFGLCNINYDATANTASFTQNGYSMVMSQSNENMRSFSVSNYNNLVLMSGLYPEGYDIVCHIYDGTASSVSAGKKAQYTIDSANVSTSLGGSVWLNNSQILLATYRSSLSYLYLLNFDSSNNTLTVLKQLSTNLPLLKNLCKIDQQGNNAIILANGDYLIKYDMVNQTIIDAVQFQYYDYLNFKIHCHSNTLGSQYICGITTGTYTGSGSQGVSRIYYDGNSEIQPAAYAQTYESQVRNTTVKTPNGVAKTSGMGGTYIGHKDKVVVYVPDLPEETTTE